MQALCEVAGIFVAHGEVTQCAENAVVVFGLGGLLEIGSSFAVFLILEELDANVIGSFRAWFKSVEVLGSIEEHL